MPTIIKILSIKSLLTSLYQREDIFFPSLVKRGEGRFFKKVHFRVNDKLIRDIPRTKKPSGINFSFLLLLPSSF